MTAATIGMVPSPLLSFLACARSLLAPIAYDAVLRVCLANIWLKFAAAVVVDAARIAGADDCAVAVAASRIFAFCDYHYIDALVICLMLFVHRLCNADRGPTRGLSAAEKEVGCRTVIVGLYAGMAFMTLRDFGEIMEEASPVKESRWQVVRAVGCLGKDVLACFVVAPTVALKVWKVTRPGWGSSSSTVEKNRKRKKFCGDGLGAELLTMDLKRRNMRS